MAVVEDVERGDLGAGLREGSDLYLLRVGRLAGERFGCLVYTCLDSTYLSYACLPCLQTWSIHFFVLFVSAGCSLYLVCKLCSALGSL
jgi:hypothetical protein